MWVGVLGALEARANTPLRLNSQRQRALLAVLTCHRGRSVSVDRLVEAIWEEEAPPQREKAAVQTVVSRLRTAIADAGGDPHVITSDDTGYRLVADATQVDASMFAALMGEGVSALSAGASDVAADALERAVGLFRGAPYEEFAHCAWAQGEATRLSERYADAVELLATALLDLGAHRELVPRLEEALDAYPYREGLQAALMTALYRCGRHTDALRSYRGFRDLLVEDLGLEPSPELSEHQGRILRHEVGLDAPPSGRPLRGYRLHEQIGSTHLGAVWRATQPGVGREVAITVVDGASPAGSSLLADLDTLAPCLGRLDHPSITQVVDAWSDAHGVYLVSQLARGTTLDEHRDGPTSAADTWLRQIRAALDHARACGVGHGDLTASHIVIDIDGNARVTGWGVTATDEVIETDDRALAALADGLGVAEPMPTGSRPNPYRGLAAFEEADSRWFFGRERVVTELCEAILDRPFLTIIGASGSGKSSLLGGGLTPALRAGRVQALTGWEIVQLTPTLQPRRTLASAVDRWITEGSSPERGLVVLVDQLEELFAMTDPLDRDGLITDLVTLLDDGAPRTRVVATLRADHLEEPLSHVALGPLIGPSLFPIGPMTSSELRRAITLPAAAVDSVVDDELVTELISELGSRPNALPLMQFTLTELFDLHGGEDLTIDQFRRLGGLEGAIARRAESVYGALDGPDRARARTMFARLVSIGEDGSWIRRRVPVREVVDGSGDVLDAFVAARLLAVEVDPISRDPIVSMTHEALAREWPRLAGWMEADREALADLRELRGSIGPWLASGRDPDRLLRGAALARATTAASERPAMLSGEELEFLQASTTSATSATRRARRVTAAVAVLAVVAVLAAALAIFQRQDARASAEAERAARSEADLGSLALQAQVLSSGPTDLALLLAVESWRRDQSPASEAALLASLTARPLVGRYVAPAGPQDPSVDSLHVIPDGGLLVRRGPLIERRDATTLDSVASTITVGPTDTLAVRSDGAEIATADADGGIRRWDLTSGRPIAGALAVAAGEGAPRIDYLSDGRIVAADPDDGLTVVDPDDGTSRRISTGEPISVLVADPHSASVVAASEVTTYLISIDSGTVEILAGLNGTRQLAFSRDGERLLVVTGQQTGSVYEIDADALRAADRSAGSFTTLRDAFIPLRYPSGVIDLDGSRVVVTGELGRAVVLDPTWRVSTIVDLGTGTLVARDDGTLVGAATRALTVIDLDGLGVLGRSLGDGVVGAASSSGDGRRIAARAVDGFDVEVTDQVSGATRRVNGSTNVPATPIMSPDGGIVALRTAYEVEFVDVVTNRVLGDRITNVGSLPEFSPDGSLVAIPSLVGVVVLRVPSLDVVAAVAPQAPGDLVTDLAWSPDGSQLALTGKRARTRIVDATTGTVVLGDVGLEVGSQLRWSSDGTRIAVIVAGASSRIIDARTGASIRELPSVRGPIELAGWTREDQRFVVVRAAEPDDLVVEFIDTSTGRRVGPSTPITELRSFVSGQITDDELLVFSPGQPAVAITTDPSEWARIACEVAGRDLTSAEWATYLGDMDGWRSTCPAST